MLTTDPIYNRPLVPVITIKNTANSSTLYTYSSFTGTSTVITTAFPLYCSVSLSQGTHGEFVIQFDDPNKAMESTITVGSRVQIDCGKQSGSVTRLISGLVRKKGYTGGSNNRLLYTISGTSTGIRLNELLIYTVSEATKLGDGMTPDLSDATRKADTLLATNLSRLTTDGVLSIANLATNSDVETFITSLSIEYGELQDVVNYITEQSRSEVVVDTTDLVNLRYELKNTLFGRGFTIKNSYTNASNDDADDTMYMRGRNWSYEDDFYKSNRFANKTHSILSAKQRPTTVEDLGFTSVTNFGTTTNGAEFAAKFRPTHSHFLPGDFYFVLAMWGTGGGGPFNVIIRICKDNGGLPLNTGGVVANIWFRPVGWPSWPADMPSAATDAYILNNEQYFTDNASVIIPYIDLDTTKDYWFITAVLGLSTSRLNWGKNSLSTATTNAATHTSNFSTISTGGQGWSLVSGLPCFACDRYRAISANMWDPKSVQAIQSGLSGGQYVESLLTNASSDIVTKESAYRQLASSLSNSVKPLTIYNFPKVTAPNIPPFPGDPIIISDSVLGLSTSGNRVIVTTCGDMTYTWGEMGRGGYEAPTNLNINAVGLHPRYR